MIQLTVKQLEDRIEDICEQYDKGDSTVYKVIFNDEHGVEKAVVLSAYNGPWEATIQEDSEGNAIVELPPRLIAQFDLKEGDEFDVEVEDGAVKFIPRKVKNGN
jgi:hypothetical protein